MKSTEEKNKKLKNFFLFLFKLYRIEREKQNMHTFSENSSGVPAFLAKLWRLVEDEETNNLIYWSAVSRNSLAIKSTKKQLNTKQNNSMIPIIGSKCLSQSVYLCNILEIFI